MTQVPDRILWHSTDTRSFRVLWMLEELELAYDLRCVPFPPRVRAPEFLDENPLGTVPLYCEDGVRMTESVAILEYLARRHGRLSVACEAPDCPLYLNALIFAEASLTWPLALILRYSRFEAAERRQPQVVEDYTRWFEGRLRGLEAMLASGAPFLAGEAFSAADIAIGYALRLAGRIGLAVPENSRIGEYWQGLQAREGYRRACAAQEVSGGGRT